MPESFSHPAKMDAQLLLWIVDKYIEAGETILDPMAGSGTTMLACTVGRNVILVELEQKFIRMALNNRQLVYMKPQLGYKMGECPILWGDARDILRARRHPYEDLWLKYPKLDFATIKSIRRHNKLPLKNARQLEGLVDKIITSPPYAETTHHTDDPAELEHLIPGRSARLSGTAGERDDNIGNLPYGQIDKIVTSPPYEGSVDVLDSKQEARAERLKKAGYDPKKYQGGKGRNLQQDWSYHPVDSIITSPPYEGTTGSDDRIGDTTKFAQIGGIGHKPIAYMEDNPSNIGNLKSDFYLEAMLQVYQQCFSVLKNGGLMILVTKNFIRNKQVIRLDTDTIKLCEQAGFKFVERHYRKLTGQSFWRVIYHQKFPDVEQINHEDVLVFRK